MSAEIDTRYHYRAVPSDIYEDRWNVECRADDSTTWTVVQQYLRTLEDAKAAADYHAEITRRVVHFGRLPATPPIHAAGAEA